MTEPPQTNLADNIIQDYLTLGDTLRLTALPNWISAQLNLSQLKTMFLLEFYSALTVSELARKLEMGNPAASVLVQQLVEQELVERSEDPKDRRRTLVRLTNLGASLIAGRRENIKINLTRWLGMMDEADLAALQRGLEALVKTMQGEQAQAEAPETEQG